MNVCVCGKPAPESAFICRACGDDVARALGDVPGLAVELFLTLAKQRRFVDEPGGVTSASSLPFDLAASTALHDLRAELVSLVRLCQAEHVSALAGLDWQPVDELASIARWLVWHVAGMSTMPWAPDTLRVVRLTEQARRVIDRPADKTYAGPCDECASDLYVELGHTQVTCSVCGRGYDLAQRREWLLSVVDDRLATGVEISRALSSLELPVTAELIRQWRHRGRLRERGHDRAARPLFRVGDVVELLLERQRSTA